MVSKFTVIVITGAEGSVTVTRAPLPSVADTWFTATPERSVSVIDTSPWKSSMSAFWGRLRFTKKLSVDSATRSPTTGTRTGRLVVRSGKLRTAGARDQKSRPASRAVPLAGVTVTLTGNSLGRERVTAT